MVLEGLALDLSIENIENQGAETVAFTVPFPTPLPIMDTLSPRPIPTLFGRIPGIFGVYLLTGQAGKSPKIALRRPILSKPVDLDDLVRRS